MRTFLDLLRQILSHMHLDGRQIENESVIEGDICIIGAGAAGISMALEWAHSPFKVILLEGGGFQVEPAIQELYKGKSTGLRYFPLHSTRLHYFGGTTGLWAGFCSDFDPIDFTKRDWVPHSGWPFTREQLDPYYQRANDVLEAGPCIYDLQHWKERDPTLVTLDLDQRVIWNKAWLFSPPTRFGRKYKEAILGSDNIHLITYANATRIDTNESASTVTQVRVRNLEGKEHTVRARYFVLACCALQNARLLLASNHIAPNGVGNDHDLVGRFFMEHVELHSASLHLLEEINPKLYQWENYNMTVRAELAMSAQKQEELRVLNGTVSLWSSDGQTPTANIDTFSDDAEALVEYVDFLERKLRGKPGRKPKPSKRFTLFTRMEQAPDPGSRVTLDSEKDALGVPLVALHWKLTELEKRSVRKLYELVGIEVASAGLGRVRMDEWLHREEEEGWPPTLGGGWHHMGTTRMNENPKEGVVDADCKVHGVSNLYIAGSSCFATGGAVNPTLTLVALTLRLSDHLRRKVGRMEVRKSEDRRRKTEETRKTGQAGQAKI